MRIVLDNWQKGFSVNGHKISNLWLDDTALLTNYEPDLMLIDRIELESKKLGLELNIGKTNVLILNRQNNNRPQT